MNTNNNNDNNTSPNQNRISISINDDIILTLPLSSSGLYNNPINNQSFNHNGNNYTTFVNNSVGNLTNYSTNSTETNYLNPTNLQSNSNSTETNYLNPTNLQSDSNSTDPNYLNHFGDSLSINSYLTNYSNYFRDNSTGNNYTTNFGETLYNNDSFNWDSSIRQDESNLMQSIYALSRVFYSLAAPTPTQVPNYLPPSYSDAIQEYFNLENMEQIPLSFDDDVPITLSKQQFDKLVEIMSINDNNIDKDDDCNICYSKIGRGKSLYLHCKHIFHIRCLKKWTLNYKTTCPCCRKDLRDYVDC